MLKTVIVGCLNKNKIKMISRDRAIEIALSLVDEGVSNVQVAKTLTQSYGYSVTEFTIRSWRKKYSSKSDKVYVEENEPFHNPMVSGNKPTKKKNYVELSEDPSVEEAIDKYNIDTEVYDIASIKINSWEGPTEGGGKQQYNQASVTVKPKKHEFSLSMLDIEEMLSDIIPFDPIVKQQNNGERLLEIGLYDAHIDKLNLHDPEKNIYSALRTLDSCVNTTIERSKGFNIGKILLVIGNDFRNTDSSKNQTSNGTPQEVSIHSKRAYEIGFNWVQNKIRELAKTYSIDVVIVPGNHDDEKCFYMGTALNNIFSETRHINVFNDIYPRKYYTWESLLLLLDHGDGVKDADVPLTMATERPIEWSKAKYREAHRGHIHTEKSIEIKGVSIRSLPSTSFDYTWHNKKGYIGNKKRTQSFVWDKKDGLVSSIYGTI